MRLVWDAEKNDINQRKHKLSFETAALVFHDPLAVSRPDPYPYEERWQTIGLIGRVIIFAVHTAPQLNLFTGEETGRIIRARKATSAERRAYAEGDF